MQNSSDSMSALPAFLVVVSFKNDREIKILGVSANSKDNLAGARKIAHLKIDGKPFIPMTGWPKDAGWASSECLVQIVDEPLRALGWKGYRQVDLIQATRVPGVHLKAAVAAVDSKAAADAETQAKLMAIISDMKEEFGTSKRRPFRSFVGSTAVEKEKDC